jgi:hypothetical protein
MGGNGAHHMLDTAGQQYQGMYAIQTDIDHNHTSTPNKIS